MPHPKTALLPPRFGETGLLPAACRDRRKKSGRRTENTFSSGESVQEAVRRKSFSTALSLLSRTTMSLRAALNPAFDPPPKPRFCERDQRALAGNRLRQARPLCRRRIRYRHNNFRSPARMRWRHHEGSIFPQIPSIPVGDHDAGLPGTGIVFRGQQLCVGGSGRPDRQEHQEAGKPAATAARGAQSKAFEDAPGAQRSVTAHQSG